MPNGQIDHRRWVMFAVVLLAVVVLVLALVACGAPNRWEKREQEYADCVDSGGEWVQIGEDHYVCEQQPNKDGEE